MRLSRAQKDALRAGSRTRWLGTREVRVNGSAFTALAERGLADVAFAKAGAPYKRLVYRLTDAGERKRRTLVPVAEASEEDLVARYIAGNLGLNEYVAERRRRATPHLLIYHWPDPFGRN